MTRITRRSLLTGAAAFAGAAALPRFGGSAAHELPPPAEPASGKVVHVDLAAAERPTALPCFGGARLPLWTLSDGAWPPVVRMRLGDRLEASFENRLPRAGEHSSVHWHGLRIANAEDGVPYLTQRPVWPGERYSYSFVPPDTGSFFFHPHCNTVEQLGRGMAGLLIVEGDETEPYDADEVIALRDWRVDEATGTFLDFFTPQGAGRAGTFGTIRSANGAAAPAVELPAAGDCRLRVYNLDNTRVIQLGVMGAEAAIVAVDGVAMPPLPLRAWDLGPAMRLDIVVRAPGDGEEAQLVDYFAPEPVALARLLGRGEPHRSGSFNPAPLRAGRMAAPDLDNAERIPFKFTATATAEAIAEAEASGAFLGSLCTSFASFWAINQQVWPTEEGGLPPPLAVLKRGKSYILELQNLTPHKHPIHLHGHSFKVLSSNRRDVPLHRADTVLLHPKERVEVALVADNPGDWMFHCHIIEHQESGMMGYIRVA
jgi:FtsP/CotA-like multicopper oxidase with cupredoxin domain